MRVCVCVCAQQKHRIDERMRDNARRAILTPFSNLSSAATRAYYVCHGLCSARRSRVVVARPLQANFLSDFAVRVALARDCVPRAPLCAWLVFMPVVTQPPHVLSGFRPWVAVIASWCVMLWLCLACRCAFPVQPDTRYCGHEAVPLPQAGAWAVHASCPLAPRRRRHGQWCVIDSAAPLVTTAVALTRRLILKWRTVAKTSEGIRS